MWTFKHARARGRTCTHTHTGLHKHAYSLSVCLSVSLFLTQTHTHTHSHTHTLMFNADLNLSITQNFFLIIIIKNSFCMIYKLWGPKHVPRARDQNLLMLLYLGGHLLPIKWGIPGPHTCLYNTHCVYRAIYTRKKEHIRTLNPLVWGVDYTQ